MKNRVLVWASIVSFVTFLIILIKGMLTNFSLKYDLVVNQKIILIQTPLLIEAAKIIGILFDTWSLLVIAILVSAYLYFKDSKKDAILFSAAMIVGAGILFILKELFHRARPLNILITETSYSFPSGHAMMSIIFFGILLYLILKRDPSKTQKNLAKILCPLLVLIIGFSRIYLNAHWMSDVFSGFFLGITIVCISIIFRKELVGFEKKLE